MAAGHDEEPYTLLFVGAFAPEIDLLREYDGRTFHDDAGKRIRIGVAECGIGNLNAALYLQKRITLDHPDEIVFVGSCGLYREPVGDDVNKTVAFSTGFFHLDLGVLQGISRIPFPIVPLRTSPGAIGLRLRDALVPVGGATNCPDSISLIDPSAIELPDGVLFENMESYGLAKVAYEADVPFSALFAITNRVGPNGSEEWRRNHGIMSETIQKSVLGVLKFG